MTGTSGSASERVAVVTASARSLPALMCGVDDGVTSNITCAWPARRSVSAGVVPRYGMWTPPAMMIEPRALAVENLPSARPRSYDPRLCTLVHEGLHERSTA